MKRTKRLDREIIEHERWNSSAKSTVDRKKWKKDLENTIDTGKIIDWFGWSGSKKEHRDNINPLYGFLRKNVGRPYDNVYSELCQRYDRRRIDGWHLHSHLKTTVYKWEDLHTSTGKWSVLRFRLNDSDVFYVDACGILRYTGQRRRPFNRPGRVARLAKQIEEGKFEKDGLSYERIDGCWFRVEYDAKKIKVKEKGVVPGNPSAEVVVERDNPNPKIVRKKQLSQKELTALGLRNEAA